MGKDFLAFVKRRKTQESASMKDKQHSHEKPNPKLKGIYLARRIESYMFLCVLAFCAYAISQLSFIKSLGISALIVAIFLGAITGNFAPHSLSLLKKTGVLAFCGKQVLRAGIVLYGFRLSLQDIEKLGYQSLGLAFFMVFSTFFLGLILGRGLGLSRDACLLVSSGSSICGAAAVLAAQSQVKAEPNTVAIAVCTVVVFGTLGMFCLPLAYFAGLIPLNTHQIGIFAGASLHEVAHALAAGIALDAASNSVLVKMLRVLMLLPFLLMLGFMLRDRGQGAKFMASFPWFALGFLCCVLLSSLPVLNRDFALSFIKPSIDALDTFLLSLAMVSLGISIRKDVLATAGFKPFLLAFLLCFWLFGAGFLAVKYFF